MGPPIITKDEVALARSLLYKTLGCALRYPCPEGLHPGLFSEEPLVGIGELLARPAGLSELIDELRDLLEHSTPGELESAYIDLFGHSVRGTCPPYESEYGEARGTMQLPHLLSDLGAFYRAFGLEISNRSHERVDHVSAQCEFMHFLAYKEAHALESGDTQLGEVTMDAEATFLHAHLGRWGMAFFRRLEHASGGGPYEALARLGAAYLGADCELLGVRPGSEKLRLLVRSETRDDVFDCGVPSECPGVLDSRGDWDRSDRAPAT